MDERAPSIRVVLDAPRLDEPPANTVRRGRRSTGIALVSGLVVATLIAVATVGYDQPLELPASSSSTSVLPGASTSVPGDGETGAAELRSLVERIGGLTATSVGTAEGAFDLVTFDPLDTDRLLAVHRDGYGPAENQLENEIWELGGETLVQHTWNPRVRHDYAQFNVDGTTTMWVHSGEDVGYAPRRPIVLDSQWTLVKRNSPVYAIRSATVGGTVFALTGSDDYYSVDQPDSELVALGVNGLTTLADGSEFDWISAPSSEILIAFPRVEPGRTAVFDVVTFERLDDHPLADRSLVQAAMSGDGRTAVGIRFDGRMERIDLRSGEVTATFGLLEPAAIDRPIELDQAGAMAVTIDRRGEVDVWWVGDDEPIAGVAGDIGITRWLNEGRAARPSSVIAPDASRVALRIGATPTTEIRWEIIETNVEAWLSAVDR